MAVRLLQVEEEEEKNPGPYLKKKRID